MFPPHFTFRSFYFNDRWVRGSSCTVSLSFPVTHTDTYIIIYIYAVLYTVWGWGHFKITGTRTSVTAARSICNSKINKQKARQSQKVHSANPSCSNWAAQLANVWDFNSENTPRNVFWNLCEVVTFLPKRFSDQIAFSFLVAQSCINYL